MKFQHSKESKKKISDAMKGRKISEETRKRMSLAQKGTRKHWSKSMSEEARRKIGIANKGRYRGKEVLERMSLAQKGKKASTETRRKMSIAAKGRIFTIEHRRKIGQSHLGEKSHLWKGGVSALNAKIRTSFEYKIWRESVFKRDSYTCVWCLQKGGKLNADHIKPFSLFPELRFAIDNGRTLCVPCHKKTDTYGRKVI